VTDTWASGDDYEAYVGRWSRLIASSFLDGLQVAPGSRWLDVGCGTGALSAAICARCAPAAVLGVDPSPQFVAWAAEHTDDPRARFEVASATNLPPAAADVVVSGLVLNFVPDPRAAVASMRAAAPEGTIAAYVWDYGGGMQLLRHFWDAAVAIDPAAAALDEAVRFPICRPRPLEDLWRAAGLVAVTSWAVEVHMLFPSFDDLWAPFLGAQGPAPSYAMSLDEEHRHAVRDRLHAQLPVAADGSIRLVARAWAVHGR
jgi:trans-aconitate methyltransferase